MHILPAPTAAGRLLPRTASGVEVVSPSRICLAQRLLYCRQQLLLYDVVVKRPDTLIEDHAIGADEEGFRDAIDAPVDGGGSPRIDADRLERIAEFAEEGKRSVIAVLVVDADDIQPVVLRQAEDHRMLLPAGDAPGR